MQRALFGSNNQHLTRIEQEISVVLSNRGDTLDITGESEDVLNVKSLLHGLLNLINKHQTISESDVVTGIKLIKSGRIDMFDELYQTQVATTIKGDTIVAKTYGQRQYVRAIQKYDITFGIGPAGTGKTFLAVAMAISALRKGIVKRVVLTRPAVEAGENLGFLPGDLKEKVDPYLRPIYDALHTVLGVEHTNRLMERGVIEIAPLAYMRGRTLDDAFVILDEAQNTTPSQMKMFLTRLGFQSKMIINGDISQIDLGKGQKSGLIDARATLKSIDAIRFVTFDEFDVVRHPLVAQIVKAYAGELNHSMIKQDNALYSDNADNTKLKDENRVMER